MSDPRDKIRFPLKIPLKFGTVYDQKASKPEEKVDKNMNSRFVNEMM